MVSGAIVVSGAFVVSGIFVVSGVLEVSGVECKYKVSTKFPERIKIIVEVEEFKGVKLKLKYKMYKEDGTLASEGYSEHGFLDESGKIISLKKLFPECYQALMGQFEE